MDITALKQAIQRRQVPHMLIFAGEEWKVQEIYLQQISKAVQQPIQRVDTVAEILPKMRRKSFVDVPKVYVVRDDKELMQTDKMQEALQSWIGDNYFVHILTVIDKRTKYYKAFKAAIIEFERLSEQVLIKYARREINASEANILRLIRSCDYDYGRMLLEIDKVKQYAGATAVNKSDINYDYYLRYLLDDGTIYQPPYDAIFDLVDAVLDRRVNESYELLEQSYAVGEATMVMLSVLYSNARAVLQVQACQNVDVARSTGLTGWQIKNAKKHVGCYNNGDLIALMRDIQYVESGIKSGTVDESIAMQYILVRCL